MQVKEIKTKDDLKQLYYFLDGLMKSGKTQIVTIKEKRKHRSLNQNRYLWLCMGCL